MRIFFREYKKNVAFLRNVCYYESKGVFSMKIGERVKRRRLELGMSADELAKKISKNRATIYRYESEYIEKLPTTIIIPLAEALKTTPSFLMGWEDEEPNQKEDAISDIFTRLRKDTKFYEAVEKIYKLSDKQLEAVIVMISSFE